MKYVKMWGLAAVAAAALIIFIGASTASAAVLCKVATHERECPTGSAYTSEIHATSEEKPLLTGGFKTVACESSTVSGTPVSEGGVLEAVHGPVTALTFGPAKTCNCEVAVLEKGSFEIHWTSGANGEIVSTGWKLTVNCSTIFGSVHCVYKTNETGLGELTGSSTTGGTATLDVTASIPREFTNELCAEEAILHTKYKVTTPDYLDVAIETEF